MEMAAVDVDGAKCHHTPHLHDEPSTRVSEVAETSLWGHRYRDNQDT